MLVYNKRFKSSHPRQVTFKLTSVNPSCFRTASHDSTIKNLHLYNAQSTMYAFLSQSSLFWATNTPEHWNKMPTESDSSKWVKLHIMQESRTQLTEAPTLTSQNAQVPRFELCNLPWNVLIWENEEDFLLILLGLWQYLFWGRHWISGSGCLPAPVWLETHRCLLFILRVLPAKSEGER